MLVKPIPIGIVFGRLTVQSYAGRDRSGLKLVSCRCSCGVVISLALKYLKSGNTKSCGCLRREYVAAKNRKHGHHGSIEYGHWKAMRQRCNDPNAEKYRTYGAVGVSVCKRWDDFQKFLDDVGPAPTSKHTLDRFPNRQGNYEPGNVRWATPKEQCRNREMTKRVVYRGISTPVAELAERFKIPYGRLCSRLRAGWSIHLALSKPVRLRRGNNQ